MAWSTSISGMQMRAADRFMRRKLSGARNR